MWYLSYVVLCKLVMMCGKLLGVILSINAAFVQLINLLFSFLLNTESFNLLRKLTGTMYKDHCFLLHFH